MEVAVTVSEDKIENIEVLDNGDTYPFLEAAKEKLIPRILENQSVTVDSITGCTGSSTGIKQATEKAVAQALAEGGSEAAAIKNFYKTPAKSTEQETIDVDVLVVGLGGSGTAAAMSAAETQYAANGNDASRSAFWRLTKPANTAAPPASPRTRWASTPRNTTRPTTAARIMSTLKR